MSRGNRYNYTNVSMEYVIKKPEEFVIPECLEACKELWRKGIETFMCSNFDDEDSRWILISDLSKENIKKMDELSKHDSRYQFDENTHYYKIIVSNNEHAREELVSLARVFSIQDSNKYLSSKDYLELYRRKDGEQYIDEYGYINTKINPEHANATLSEALKNNNDEHLYVSSEDRVYQSELYLYWHLRYLKSLQKKSKEEIKNIIGQLKEEEIKKFVIPRVNLLEEESRSTIIGHDNECVYQDYISKKVGFKISDGHDSKTLLNLNYDDIDSYIEFIKHIKAKDYSELTLFNDIMFFCYSYLSKGCKYDEQGLEEGRRLLFFNKMNQGFDSISVQEIAQNKLGLGTDKAGLAQNLFKLLGISSKVVMGTRNGERHSYNIVYPNGYHTFPAILFDPSIGITLTNKAKNNSFSIGYYKILTEEEYQKLINGEKIEIETISSAQKYIETCQDNLEDITGYDIESPIAIYSISNGSKSRNNPEELNSRPINL